MNAIQIETFVNPAQVVKAVNVPDVGAPAPGEVVTALEAAPLNQSGSHSGPNYRDVRSFGAPDRRRHDLSSGRRHLWFRPIQGSHRGCGKEPWEGVVHDENVIRLHVDLTRSHEGGIHVQACRKNRSRYGRQ